MVSSHPGHAGQHSQTPFSRWLEILCVALVYIASARLGQIFAIEPGNISPIWLPSGLMLSLVIIRGYYLWPGIFIGAFVGNIWPYADFTTLGNLLPALGAAFFNGMGDVFAIIGAVWLLEHRTGSVNPFSRIEVFAYFLLFGAILGSLVSALLGVLSLAAAGFVAVNEISTALLIWWLGDGMGVLIIAPTILIFHFHQEHHNRLVHLPELVCHTALVVLVCLLNFQDDLIPGLMIQPGYLLIPLLLWSLMRLDLRITFVSTLFFTISSVLAIHSDTGPFIGSTPMASFLSLHVYLILVATSVFLIGSIISDREHLLRLLAKRLEQDELTGAHSRMYFDRLLDHEMRRFKRSQVPFSVVMFDLDHFKDINDTLGHMTGDKILKLVVRVVQKGLRESDTLARWGGEEFMILLPETRIEGARILAENCRKRVFSSHIHGHDNLSISLGVAEFDGSMGRDQFLQALDQAMYQSKSAGRNRTTLTGPNPALSRDH